MQRGSACVPDRETSAFDPFLADLGVADASGVRIELWPAVRLTVTMAYRGAEESAGAAMAAFVNDAPDATVLKTGPGTWLTLSDGTFVGPDDAAASFDQGDGYALLKLRGAAAMTVLQKGIFVDLAAALASSDACVCSVIAHVNVIVWRASSDTLGVAVPRSFVGSFWHWLSTAAAAEGIPIGR
jgi:heterotetrameric sarcosine oxidase gamma subunit